MSVIGRLDKQVDELIITPLEKRKSEVNLDEAESSDSDERVDNARREGNQRVKEDSLPVWML
jgi:hypothetical protein